MLTPARREYIRNWSKIYRAEHRDEINRKNKIWRHNNPDKVERYRINAWKSRIRSLKGRENNGCR